MLGVMADSYNAPAGGSWLPTDIAGLQWWLDASDATAFTYSTGSIVTQWNDKSANGYHAVQAVVARQGTRTGVRNGLATVHQSAAGKAMAATPTVPISSSTFAFTSFVVFIKTGANASFEGPFTMSDTSTGVPFSAYGINRAGWTGVGAIGTASIDLRSQATICVWTHQSYRNVDIPTLTGWIAEYRNKLPIIVRTNADNTSWSTTNQKLMMGGRNDYSVGLVGEIAEILVYDQYLSDTNRQTVEDYLINKWGIVMPTFPFEINWQSSFWAEDPQWTKPAEGGTVASWRNDGRFGATADNAVQVTEASKPTYTASFAGLNNKPAIVFDGVDDVLNTGTANISQANDVFIVAWLDPTHGADPTIVDSSNAGGRHQLRNYGSSGTVTMFAGTIATMVNGQGADGAFMINGFFNTTLSNMRFNGIGYNPSGTIGTNVYGAIRIASDSGGAATAFFKGAIAFIGVKDTALTTAELKSMEQWAISHYGVPSFDYVGFSPLSISGCRLWFDASDAATITSSGGAVSQWNDKSGNGLNVTQATGSKQPLIGASSLNGLNVLTFDGTDDCIGITTLTQLVNASTGEWTSFVALKSTLLTGTRYILSHDSTTGSNRIAVGGFTSSQNLQGTAFNNAIGGFNDSGPSMTLNFPTVLCTKRTTTTIEMFNYGLGAAGATATTGTPTTNTGPFNIGATAAATPLSFFSGDIAEVIWYNAALSVADQKKVESYLKMKWGTF